MVKEKKTPAAGPAEPVDQPEPAALEQSEGCTVECEDGGDLKQYADPDGVAQPEPWDDPADDDDQGADRG